MFVRPNMKQDVKPSFEEIALKAEKFLFLGVGGGGDVIQSIPLVNYLKRLGKKKENIYVGGVSARWWRLEGHVSFGAEVFSIDDIVNGEPISETAALLSKETRVINSLGREEILHETVVSELLEVPAVIFCLDKGVVGLSKGLNDFIKRFGIDMVVGVDCGSDSFYTLEEAFILTPLVDAMVLAALTNVKVPCFFGLAGYGCDAELHIEELERNVGEAIRKKGFLGAYGITQQDIAVLERVFEMLPRETVEKWPMLAAKGELGIRSCKRFWNIRVTPLTAVILFFDPLVIVEHINPLPKMIMNTKSLKEAEDILISHNVISETRLPQFLPLERRRS